MPLRVHETDTALLREAIAFTSGEIGFNSRLIEKDYFCSVVLEYLAASDASLVFKGGTSLSKIHVGFYRLSEDLDFSISTPLTSSRGERSNSVGGLKTIVDDIPKRLVGFQVLEALTGSNKSTQYNAIVAYQSPVDGHSESIRIEIGLREPHLTGVEQLTASTAVLNPLNRSPLVEGYPVRCLSYEESMAEKLRAALCREEVAIRDFYDVDYAVETGRLSINAPGLIDLLKRKISVPGTPPPDMSAARIGELRRQVGTELRSVLREPDVASFDLDRAVATVSVAFLALGSSR